MWPPPPRKPGSISRRAASRARFWGLVGAVAGTVALVYASFLVDVNAARVTFVQTSTFDPQFRIDLDDGLDPSGPIEESGAIY